MDTLEFATCIELTVRTIFPVIPYKSESTVVLGVVANSLRDKIEKLPDDQKSFGCFIEEIAKRIDRITHVRNDCSDAPIHDSIGDILSDIDSHIRYLVGDKIADKWLALRAAGYHG